MRPCLKSTKIQARAVGAHRKAEREATGTWAGGEWTTASQCLAPDSLSTVGGGGTAEQGAAVEDDCPVAQLGEVSSEQGHWLAQGHPGFLALSSSPLRPGSG